MRVYRINIMEARDEWYATLREAVERRKELVTAPTEVYGAPLSIDAVDLLRLPPKAFAVLLLNQRRGRVHASEWIKATRQVTPPYKWQVDSNDSMT